MCNALLMHLKLLLYDMYNVCRLHDMQYYTDLFTGIQYWKDAYAYVYNSFSHYVSSRSLRTITIEKVLHYVPCTR